MGDEGMVKARGGSGRKLGAGFSLLELLVAAAVLIILLGVLMGITNSTFNTWRSAMGQAAPFREARGAFDRIASQLSQATLQNYWDYVGSDGRPRGGNATANENFTPSALARQSDLHFIISPTSLLPGFSSAAHPAHGVFFQKIGSRDYDSPAGNSQGNASSSTSVLANLLSVNGFFVEYGDSGDFVPPGIRSLIPYLGGKKRARLVEVDMPPAYSKVYASTSKEGYDLKWIDELKANMPQDRGQFAQKQLLAENILALVLRAREPEGANSNPASLAPNYTYDSRAWENAPKNLSLPSRNQLPPIIDILMVAIDERGAERLSDLDRLSPTGLGLDTLFKNSSQLEQDLQSLEKTLNELRVNYRIFRTSLRMENSKWGTI